jgi:hypothetical protein
MKKMVLFCGLLSVVLGPLAAQTLNPALYEELTLSGFTGWRDSYTGEESRKFKIPVLYSSTADLRLAFTDPSLEEKIEFETEETWPAMTSGQKLTVYFTAQGPWVWDRRLDALDYGNGRIVLAGGAGALAAEDSAAPPADSGQDKAPAVNPSPDEIASSKESPQEPEESAGFDYGRAPKTVIPQRITVHISGKTPLQGRYYRLQVGSFSVRGNATRAAASLKNAGLSPAFEEYQKNVRVVLPRVPGEDVVETARKIGGAGFSEVWCREEP